MLEVQSDVQPVKKERNAAAKAEVREILGKMEPGQSFVIEGSVKKSMVKHIAIAMNVKVKIAVGTDGKTRCWKM